LAITLLERWGHRVEVAENGQIALDLLSKRQFDVVLMDMMMPVMDGLEATRRIRARESGSRTPIIAMTANAMEADRERCLSAGMDDYISKPIKANELQQLLQHFSSAHVRLAMSEPAPLAHAGEALTAAAFDYAGAMTRVDQEVLQIIAQPFADQWPEELDKIKKGLETGDLKVVLHTTHALKGTLSMFGAKPASELAHQMEQCAMRSDAEGLAKLIAPLIVELDRLIAVIPLERVA
jgi:CheY-like chemotaxis protein/HPt (histidine-containing phosphotransfer) domain-containing protein